MATVQDLTSVKLGSIDEGCLHLGRVLGMDEPVPAAVLISALSSDEYARNLLISRKEPAFLKVLLDNPVRAQPPGAPAPGGAEMLRSASAAIARWSRVGFSVASEEVFEARLRACLSCPDIRHTDLKGTVHKLMKTKATCGLCGCDVEKKARMSSERCPGRDPRRSGHDRWGQATGSA